jgi:hypothetical protein
MTKEILTPANINEIHATTIESCITAINKEIDKLNLQNKTNKYKEQVCGVIIADRAKKFNLRIRHVKAILFGKFKV